MWALKRPAHRTWCKSRRRRRRSSGPRRTSGRWWSPRARRSPSCRSGSCPGCTGRPCWRRSRQRTWCTGRRRSRSRSRRRRSCTRWRTEGALGRVEGAAGAVLAEVLAVAGLVLAGGALVAGVGAIGRGLARRARRALGDGLAAVVLVEAAGTWSGGTLGAPGRACRGAAPSTRWSRRPFSGSRAPLPTFPSVTCAS